MKKITSKLERQFNEICDMYLERFYQLHEFEKPYDYDVWIGGRYGEIVEIADCFFNFLDIKYDVDHFDEIKPDKIFEWYDYSLKCHELGLPKNITYEAWCKDAPLPYAMDDINRIKAFKVDVENARRILEAEIEKMKNNDSRECDC